MVQNVEEDKVHSSYIQKLTFETMKVWRLNYGNPS